MQILTTNLLDLTFVLDSNGELTLVDKDGRYRFAPGAPDSTVSYVTKYYSGAVNRVVPLRWSTLRDISVRIIVTQDVPNFSCFELTDAKTGASMSYKDAFNHAVSAAIEGNMESHLYQMHNHYLRMTVGIRSITIACNMLALLNATVTDEISICAFDLAFLPDSDGKYVLMSHSTINQRLNPVCPKRLENWILKESYTKHTYEEYIPAPCEQRLRDTHILLPLNFNPCGAWLVADEDIHEMIFEDEFDHMLKLALKGKTGERSYKLGDADLIIRVTQKQSGSYVVLMVKGVS